MVTLRRATIEDARILYDWANDPVTRANSFNTEAITWEEHMNWMNNRLSQEGCYLAIAENEAGQAVGTVRLDISGDSATISYAVAPDMRRRGYGRGLLQAAEQYALSTGDIHRLIGEVKADNSVSAHCFASNGYVETGDSADVRVFSKNI